MCKTVRSILAGKQFSARVVRQEKLVSRRAALQGKCKGMIENLWTRLAITGLLLFCPVPLSIPLLWLYEGELHTKTSIIKAAEQPLLFYLIIMIAVCNGCALTCLCVEAVLKRVRLQSKR